MTGPDDPPESQDPFYANAMAREMLTEIQSWYECDPDPLPRPKLRLVWSRERDEPR